MNEGRETLHLEVVADICCLLFPSSRTCLWRNSFIFHYLSRRYSIFLSALKSGLKGTVLLTFCTFGKRHRIAPLQPPTTRQGWDCKFHLRTTIVNGNGKRHQNIVQNYSYEYASKDTCCNAGWRARDHDDGGGT